MSLAAVEARGLSKRFKIRRERYRSFQEYVVNAFRRRAPAEEFWALRDVSFAVPPGTGFGVIGENGSGKSTLLKLIAGILRPTSGSVRMSGRLAALLELGAGFHPDLTGRENVYLNGSILGFSRREIERRMDAIIDFTEIERFIDTPLKHYSSGMQVRLGFAIAVHSDPDVLIADEVLSVGDEPFQRKCRDRIDDFMRRGKTIILVSHDLTLIRNVCTDALWLDHGRVRAAGSSVAVLDEYLDFANRKDRARLDEGLGVLVPGVDADAARRWGSREVEIQGVELLDDTGRATAVFETGAPMRVRLHYHARERVRRPTFGLSIHLGEHLLLAGPNTGSAGLTFDALEGAGVVEYRVRALPLLRGLYHLSVAAIDEHGVRTFDHHDRLYVFHVQPGDVRELYGMVWMDAEWSHEPARAWVATPSAPSRGA